MTEYGVQTNNLFDLLNVADEAKPAAPKPKNRRKKRGSAAGQAPASGQPSQGAKPAGSPAGPRKDAQPGVTKSPAPARPASQQPPAARVTTVAVSGGRGSATGPRPVGNAPAAAPAGNAGRGGSQRGNGPAPAGRGGSGRGGPVQGNRPQEQRPSPNFDRQARQLDESHVSFEEGGDSKQQRPGDKKPHTSTQQPPRGREFDRHSGSGRNPTENKKGGHGGSNWGTQEDEIAALEDAKNELKADSPEAQKEEKKKKKKKKGKKPEEEEEKEKKDEIPDEQLKLLDDFEKERAAKAAKLALPKARQAGEGVKADPSWSTAVKLEKGSDEPVFFKPKDESKGKEPEKAEEASKKPSKSALRNKKRKERREQEARKLAEQNIQNMFDFSAKKENDFGGSGRGRGRGPRVPREGGSSRGPREGGSGRGAPREGGSSRGPREGGSGRGPREGGSSRGGSARGQPKKYSPGDSEGPQFDDSAFPALQVGPPPITVD